MTWFHEWFGAEYLELYSHRDDDEAKQQVAFFREHCGSVHGPLLDLACGKGRHIAELRAEGYRAAGCDLSFVLLRTGHAEYGPLPVQSNTRTAIKVTFLATPYLAPPTVPATWVPWPRQSLPFWPSPT